MRNFQLHTSPLRVRRPVRPSMLMPPLKRVAGWALIATATLLVPVSVYAWHDTSNRSNAKNNMEGSSNVSLDTHTVNNAPVTSTTMPTPSENSSTDSQSSIVPGGTNTSSDGGSQHTTSHVSASVNGNASSTVTVNGETTQVPANNTINKTITSNNNNSSVNITMQSSMDQSSSGSSSLHVQVNSSSITEGGQR